MLCGASGKDTSSPEEAPLITPHANLLIHIERDKGVKGMLLKLATISNYITTL